MKVSSESLARATGRVTKLAAVATIAMQFAGTSYAALNLEPKNATPAEVQASDETSALEEEQITAPAPRTIYINRAAPVASQPQPVYQTVNQADQIISPVTHTPITSSVIAVGEPKDSTSVLTDKIRNNNEATVKALDSQRQANEDRFAQESINRLVGPPAAPLAGPAAQPYPAHMAQPAQPFGQSPQNGPIQVEIVGGGLKSEVINSGSYDESDDDSSDDRGGRSSTKLDLPNDQEEKTTIRVRGGGGLPGMNVDDRYTVNGRYSAGFGLGADVGEHLGVEAAYSYNVYGIALSTMNPLAQNPGYYGLPQNNGFENYALKQNVFDVALKIYVVDRQSRLRPYFSGGAGYSKGYVNYDQSLLNAQRQMGISGSGSDYEISSYLGQVGGGLDLAISKNLSIGGQFKYYTVLSSHENQPLNDAALFYGQGGNMQGGNPFYAQNYYAAQGTAEKQALGGSLAQSSFYSILLGATLSF